ncbi:MAG: MAPEG family protein [Cellvibrionaceae bacterium]
MSPENILYPVIAMFFLTISVVIYMAVQRIVAVKNKEVDGRHYILYSEGEESPRLQKLTRHVKNLFEIPPLFYLVVLFLFVTGSVSLLTVSLAWSYFFARCVHSFIHLSSNNVLRRFVAFLVSVVVLILLWLVLLVSIIS